MGFFGFERNKKPGPELTQAYGGFHLPYAGMTPTGSMGMISAPETLKGAPRDAAKLEQIRNFLLLSGGNFAPCEADFRNL